MTSATDTDYLIIGGGFYGAALALFLRSLDCRIKLLEREDELMTHASRVNQARIHTGFHYPRNALTAVKSKILQTRFVNDFPDAVVDDFNMLYAIARNRSKVSAKRFYRMFHDMGAPIKVAATQDRALFNPDMIAQSFDCQEFAFDYRILRDRLAGRLDSLEVDVALGTEVVGLTDHGDYITVQLQDGTEQTARYVFNITYAQTNRILRLLNAAPAKLKHELTELALVRPPQALQGKGITVMDGPFFSMMPYPAAGLYSLSHVRYTPHAYWLDADGAQDPYSVLAARNLRSKAAYMIADAQRYLPSMSGVSAEDALFEVKTVLTKNEKDDGRPILFDRSSEQGRVISVMGGKIDNIYDLFDYVRQSLPEWQTADERYLGGQA